MMSPSDLSATPSSEWLQERCSRNRHGETYDNKTNLKQLTKQRYANSAIQHQLALKTQRKLKTGLRIFRSKAKSALSLSRFTRHIPPFKLALISELSHVVFLKATSEPRVDRDSQLFSRPPNRRIQMPLASFSGVYPPVLVRPLYLDVPERGKCRCTRRRVMATSGWHAPNAPCHFLNDLARWVLDILHFDLQRVAHR